jgi:hypothetical protein
LRASSSALTDVTYALWLSAVVNDAAAGAEAGRGVLGPFDSIY